MNPDLYDQYRSLLLQAFQQPTAGNLQEALAANELSLVSGKVTWNDEEETICKLAGASHIRDVPWLK